MSDEIKKLKEENKHLSNMVNDLIVGNQAAWIEWRRGKGPEHALQWIENGLFGPGLIPQEEVKYSDNAQFFFNANKSDPFPECFCGNPSSIMSMKKGYCCQSHCDEVEHG